VHMTSFTGFDGGIEPGLHSTDVPASDFQPHRALTWIFHNDINRLGEVSIQYK